MSLFGGGLGGFVDNILTGGAGNKADNVTQNGIGIANQYGNDVTKLGNENYDLLKALGLDAMNNANQYKQDNTAAIQASNEAIDKQQAQAEANLANMGYTPQSNNVYANQNAEFAKQKSLTQATLQNQANAANLAAQQGALGLAGNMYNSAFNNKFGALSGANQAQLGANNALGAYYANKYNNGLGLLGAGLGLAGGLLG